ncbi:hypothetical protein ACHAXA_000054 [Cyclostephanos tholiformis]|uniref:Uncharacterized protein n=1 Tax=Cyclostephanos tholiformis TaxID=382380 RepID=A0ABD3SRJ3_9STRA
MRGGGGRTSPQVCRRRRRLHLSHLSHLSSGLPFTHETTTAPAAAMTNPLNDKIYEEEEMAPPSSDDDMEDGRVVVVVVLLRY